MYELFYDSTEEELGRQAFLQHILRRAHNEGLSQWSMIYNTEESLLNQIAQSEINKNNNDDRFSLKELIQNYRLLVTAYKIAEIPIENNEEFEQFKNPIFADWLEETLRSKYFEPFILINSRRFYSNNRELFAPNKGAIIIFKLHSNTLKLEQLPQWLHYKIKESNNYSHLPKIFGITINNMIKTELKNRPWLILTKNRKDNILNNLNAVGNWSFKLTRNETIHSYPATFVHAIPSSLISALGLKGQLIMDPFGGAGQTAIEGVKQGCQVITSDCNSVATLITKVKSTYLDIEDRNLLRQISISDLKNQKATFIPEFPNPEKWHNKKTLIELRKIMSYILCVDQENKTIGQFLKLCFSDILTSTTARKGKDYAYFADNTPLPKGQQTPEYINAFELLKLKINRNLNVLERLYSTLERKGKSVKEELRKVSVLQLNISESNFSDFKVEKNSVACIITSPPYLCMVDYTYGNRLSYYWLFPEKMEKEFKQEIGSRRCRTAKNIKEEYLKELQKFAHNATEILKKDGFLCTVIGTPTATQFSESDLFKEIDKIFEEEGLRKFWFTKRQIHWHRNPGLGKLKSERITVYVNSNPDII